MAPLKIIVVGGGMGGLAAAAPLAKSGHDVTVFERSKHRGGVGFAFRITPNSDRCLRHLGIDTIAGGACAADGIISRDAQGNILFQLKENTERKDSGPASVFAFRVRYPVGVSVFRKLTQISLNCIPSCGTLPSRAASMSRLV